MKFLDTPTRNLFFGGKGGVGKTSMACATAVALADRGKRVLLVSTDPASNLRQVFGTEIGEEEPTAIVAVPGLFALNINPQAAAQAYRDRIVGPVRNALPPNVVKSMEEQLSGACTTEIAAFDEFTELLTGGMTTAGFDYVIFDTAPTGHTLLLLDATGAYHRDVVRNLAPGIHVRTPMMQLQDPKQTKMLIVALPETTPVLEAESLQADLQRAGIEPWAWAIYSSPAAAKPGDALLATRAAEELTHIERVRSSVQRVALVPWQIIPPTGYEALKILATSSTVAPVTIET